MPWIVSGPAGQVAAQVQGQCSCYVFGLSFAWKACRVQDVGLDSGRLGGTFGIMLVIMGVVGGSFRWGSGFWSDL